VIRIHLQLYRCVSTRCVKKLTTSIRNLQLDDGIQLLQNVSEINTVESVWGDVWGDVSGDVWGDVSGDVCTRHMW